MNCFQLDEIYLPFWITTAKQSELRRDCCQQRCGKHFGKVWKRLWEFPKCDYRYEEGGLSNCTQFYCWIVSILHIPLALRCNCSFSGWAAVEFSSKTLNFTLSSIVGNLLIGLYREKDSLNVNIFQSSHPVSVLPQNGLS